jgi:hypothetical protein
MIISITNGANDEDDVNNANPDEDIKVGEE